MISYQIKCYICKQNYDVNEKHAQYTAVKRNMKGRHICTDCIEAIERDATIATGLNRALIDQLEALKIDQSV